FDSLMILTMQMLSLAVQGFLHTEVVRSYGVFDFVLNSPSHHRVHHACNPQYLDKNYGNVLIIWDRMLGTFAPEGEKPTYGLTHRISPTALSESYLGYAADLFRALAGLTWRQKLFMLLASPARIDQAGMTPTPSTPPIDLRPRMIRSFTPTLLCYLAGTMLLLVLGRLAQSRTEAGDLIELSLGSMLIAFCYSMALQLYVKRNPQSLCLAPNPTKMNDSNASRPLRSISSSSGA
ncbi:MAG: fatty acid hydroxylase family protein, partial [Proteobacteria bacterium]